MAETCFPVGPHLPYMRRFWTLPRVKTRGPFGGMQVSSSQVQNASTGIGEIDYLCGGGIPRSAIVFVEETGTEKSNYPSYYLAAKFLNDGLSRGEKGVIILTEHAAPEYFNSAPYANIDLLSHKKSGLLTIIDAFSGYAGMIGQPLASQADITIDNPTNTVKLLDEIRNSLLTFSEGGYKGKIRMIIDSFSTVMTAVGFQKCWSLLLGLVPIHRITECSTVAIFFPGMHSNVEVESFERLLDGVIEFSGRETGDDTKATSFVHISKMRRNPFQPERALYTREEFNIRFYLKKH